MAKEVLVVTEEEDVAEFLQLALRSEGYEVRLASDWEEASGLYAERRPDVVLASLAGDGAGTCGPSQVSQAAEWRETHREVPAVLLAGDLSHHERELARRSFDRLLDRHVLEVSELLRSLDELTSAE